MSNWDSPWGPAEKYAYRQGIAKGRKLQEDEDIRTLKYGGFSRATELLATGEVPFPTVRFNWVDKEPLEPGTYKMRVVKVKSKKGRRNGSILVLEAERDDCA